MWRRCCPMNCFHWPLEKKQSFVTYLFILSVWFSFLWRAAHKYGMDYFTKWPESYPIRNKNTDQRKHFKSKVFQQVYEILGIHKTQTTIGWEAGMGQRPKQANFLEQHQSVTSISHSF